MSAVQHATVRHMFKADLKEVLPIEEECFTLPWEEKDFVSRLDSPGKTILKVAESLGVVVGFVVYEIHTDCVRIVSIAVPPHKRRLGIGTQLLDQVIRSANGKHLVVDVFSDYLEAQLFFRERAFRCTQLITANFGEYYVFQTGTRSKRLKKSSLPKKDLNKNRISKHLDS